MAAKKKTQAGATRKRDRTRFAGYPSADAYEIQYEVQLDENGKKVTRTASDGKKVPVFDTEKPLLDKLGQEKKKKAKSNGQLPWGFVLKDTGERRNWIEKGKTVPYAKCRRRRGGGFENRKRAVWIREDQLQNERCLEVVFVDIGQGDGCFLVTPDDKRMVIDAGEASNMLHYLNWRHGTKKKTSFEAAIVSHPDSDHYMGFTKLFQRENFFFETVYTNGLMERFVPKKKPKAGAPKPTSLGPVRKIDGKSLVTELVTSKKELKDFLANTKDWASKEVPRAGSTKKKKTGKQFPTMLNEALEGWKVKVTRPAGGEDVEQELQGKTLGDYRMLSATDKFMPGYGEDDKLTLEVLGPVADTVENRPMLEWLDSNVGKTKNGHSVVLRLQYGNVSMMLGGDLNIPSEHLLMSHHTGMSSPPDAEHEEAFIEAARRVFQVDIAKSCHHGSSDFTPYFLRALNPLATVISSGDDEPHSHPRSDTLGAIGYYSRSHPRPLIFSTELARSSKDSNQKPWELRREIMAEVEKVLGAKAGPAQDKAKLGLANKLKTDIPRSVAVYGAITVVTDGKKVIIYQKLERKSAHGSYDIYRLEPSGEDGQGPLMYQSKH